MQRSVAYLGREHVIEYAIRSNGDIPALEFFNGLSVRDQAKIQKLFEWLGDRGEIKNKEKFKRIEGTSFYEFKSFQIRMPCYRSGDRYVITHGFSKKQDAIPKTEIERMERLKGEYENLIQSSRKTEK